MRRIALHDKADVPSASRVRPRGLQETCGALRCLCGSLLARRVPGGVELKCRRCKRTIVLALEPGNTPSGSE